MTLCHPITHIKEDPTAPLYLQHRVVLSSHPPYGWEFVSITYLSVTRRGVSRAVDDFDALHRRPQPTC
jgi:hypothetical protein